MHPSTRFFQQAQQAACKITLFTRQNCQLCVNAKQNLSNVWDTRPFVYKEIDVMKPDGKIWRELYEFDTPVIHIRSSREDEELPKLAGKAVKLMHRFTEEEVKAKMDEVEQKA